MPVSKFGLSGTPEINKFNHEDYLCMYKHIYRKCMPYVCTSVCQYLDIIPVS